MTQKPEDRPVSQQPPTQGVPQQPLNKMIQEPAYEKKTTRRGKGWVVKTLFLMLLASTVLGGLVAMGGYWHFSKDLPKIITVADYRPLTVTRILAAPEAVQTPSPQATGQAPAIPVVKDEQVLGEFYKERRYVIPFEKMPDVIVQAFISAEDDRFFEHGGVNFLSMLRASIANFRAGRYVQGGSTITQQVAKSLIIKPQKNLARKIRELILAYRIESTLSKQQILYLYLNQIYLGHGAYGVQAAARTYYRKDVSQLTVAEAAVLGGLPQAPTNYSPIINPKKAKERQLYVLKRMYENKYLTQAQLTEAAAQPLKIYHDEDTNLKTAPYLVEHVRRYLAEKYGDKALYEDGLIVTVPTTLAVAKAAGKSLKTGLAQVDKRIGYRGAVQRLDAAAVEKFLIEERVKLIEKKLHYQLLMPDGRLDPFEAMRAGGLQSDGDLLEAGEVYQGVVTSFDEKKCKPPKGQEAHCSAGVMIGAVRAELPLSKMMWARPARDEKNPNAVRPEPSMPSKVFRKGDVILVKVPENSTAPKDAPIVELEQEPLVQGALVSIDVQTGNILAMEGGYDFESSEFNRATQALRQPGSSFKPIVYSAGLERGYSPATIIVDSPIVYEDTVSGTGKWKPSNFEEKFYGDTTFRQALIKSRNIPSIKIAQALTIPFILDYAKRLGIDGKFPADLSISLGSASVSLLEMTKAYALFPRLGRKVAPIFFNKVFDRDGKLLEEAKPQTLPAQITLRPAPQPTLKPGQTEAQFNAIIPGKQGIPMPEYPTPGDTDQVLDPRVAFVMTHLMNEVVNYGTGHDAKALGRAAAGKTGTTTDYIDAWFMGFTPTVVTGVWVGFDSQKSIGPLETGARAALPIWLSFMQAAVKNYPDTEFTIPPGVTFATIDEANGKLASPNSSTAIKEAFIDGTQPTDASTSSPGSSETQSDFFKEDTE